MSLAPAESLEAAAASRRLLLQRAGECNRSGQFADARALCAEALKTDPRDFEALQLASVVALRTRDFPTALELIGRALEVNRDDAGAHLNQGLIFQSMGLLEQALASYDRAIVGNPKYAAAYCNRGLVLSKLGRAEAALDSYDRAIAITDTLAEVHLNRGVLLNRLGRPDLALESYDRALQIRPNDADALFNRGNVLQRMDRLDEALATYDAAIRARPAHVGAYVNRANALKDTGQWDDALASCDQAIAIDARDPSVHSTRGVLLFECRRIEEAVDSFDRALALRPGFGAAIANRGFAYLLAGDFGRGWADREFRWESETGPLAGKRRSFRQPLWLGNAPIAGKRVLLHCEQGLGDTLQFCRYATWIADLGATVIFEVPPPLAALMSTLAGVSTLVLAGDALPPFHYHCPLMSLPRAFRTTLSTIPARVPYLRADAQKVREWKERLGASPRLRVGLVWSGGFRPSQPELWSTNRRRNIPLAKLARLAHPQIDFISLQKGEAAESELAQITLHGWDNRPPIDWSTELRDFSDTAALLENLDLLISVDTSTAHLAGALGKPVWILNRFDACWRWLLDRADSPWYPTARLYRQTEPGGWDAVVESVQKDLGLLLGRRRDAGLESPP